MSDGETKVEDTGKEMREIIQRFRNSQQNLKMKEQEPTSMIARRRKD